MSFMSRLPRTGRLQKRQVMTTKRFCNLRRELMRSTSAELDSLRQSRTFGFHRRRRNSDCVRQCPCTIAQSHMLLALHGCSLRYECLNAASSPREHPSLRDVCSSSNPVVWWLSWLWKTRACITYIAIAFATSLTYVFIATRSLKAAFSQSSLPE
jgi:hypothetical protein